MNCPYCDTPLPEGATVCPACRAEFKQPASAAAEASAPAAAPETPQKRFCANCGRELRAGAAFCAGCGSPVGGQKAQPPTRPLGQSVIPPAAPQMQGQAPAAPYPPPQQAPYGQQYPQQPYGRQTCPPRPYVPSQPRRKRKLAVPIIALVLAVAILFTGFVSPGFFLKKARAEALINRVQVHIPAPTGPEAVVRLVGDLALRYYIEAGLYLEKLSQYDVDKLDEAEFAELAINTVAAYENAEKICACLSEAVDLWMQCDDVREKPTYTVLQTAEEGASGGLLAMKAFAAEASRSEIRAKDIIEAFDKAKSGQKINAVAELLGTDAKHAAAQLKMALAGDEKESYDKIAEQATTCIKVAKTLKTAGTVAGVVIAAAPIASGAAAAMATGEMLATGTGVVVSTVNAGLEMTSTGAMLYHGTDENEVTQIADAISDSKFMQTVNTLTSVAGLGYNIKNVFNKLEGFGKAGASAKEINDYLTNLVDGKVASDVYGILSFGLSNLDALPGIHGQLVKQDVNSLITLVTHTEEGGGLTIDISDTVIGTGKNQIAAVDRLLDELGVGDAGTRSVLDKAVDFYRGEPSDEVAPADPEDPAPLTLVDAMLSDYAYIAPNGGGADLDRTVEMVETVMKVAAGSPQLNYETDEPDDEPEPAATPQPTDAPQPTATPQPTPEVHGGYEKGIKGSYTVVIDDELGIARNEHVAEVTLSGNGAMEITFPVTSTMITNFDTGATVTKEGTAWFRGTYDPATHVFAGTGSSDLTDLLIHGSDIVLTFEPDASPVQAAGYMYSHAELFGKVESYTFTLTMVKLK